MTITIGTSFTLFFIILLFVIAATRKGGDLLTKKPKKITSFTSDKNISEIFQKLLHFSQISSYKVEAIDETKFILILGENANLNGFGFFYPIYLSEDSDGKTKIEVGIKSKAIQAGPVVTKSLEKFTSNVKAAILSE